jgi:hypothetical protein
MINSLELKKLIHLDLITTETFAIPKYTKNKELDYGIGIVADIKTIAGFLNSKKDFNVFELGN